MKRNPDSGRTLLAQLAASHFLVDAYSSMLGAFLPFLYRELSLTLTQAGLAGGVLTLSSALLQPVYGYLADRLRSGLFVALAPAVAGVFISSLGLAASFPMLLIGVFLGGIGIASFHPQAAALAAGSSRRRTGLSLSLFFGCGMLGYSMGPIFISGVVSLAGLGHSYLAAIPGLAMSAFLLLGGGVGYHASRQPKSPAAVWPRISRQWRPLLRLYLLVVIRSAVQMVFVAFLPLYFTARGHGEFEASLMLSLFLFAGGSASLLGGSLADRFGGGRVILVSMAGLGPSLLAFLWTGGAISMAFCAAGGAFLLLTTPVNVAMAQRLVPDGAGTISALMMGFAWGVGGLMVPVAGLAAETWGLGAVLAAVAATPFLGVPLAQPLQALHQPAAAHQEGIA